MKVEHFSLKTDIAHAGTRQCTSFLKEEPFSYIRFDMYKVQLAIGYMRIVIFSVRIHYYIY